MRIITAVGELKYTGTAFIAGFNHILYKLYILVIKQRNYSGAYKGVQHLQSLESAHSCMF